MRRQLHPTTSAVRRHSARCRSTALAWAGFAVALAGLAGGTPAAGTGPGIEAALTNEEVIELTELGLGDEVLIAKIHQAPRVDFDLDTGGLIALKTAGVSDAVIAAMLERSTGRRSDGASPLPGGAVGAGSQPSATDVILETRDGGIPLTSIRGDLSTTWAYVATLTFLDFPGTRGRDRTGDRSPSLLVAATEDPVGRLYWAKLDPSKGKDARSLKMGRARMFGTAQISTPDKDWTIPFEAREEERGLWRLVPLKELAPGEYGLWVRPGWSFPSFVVGEQGVLFDFGVD